MIAYVLGFLFSSDGRVVLIKKKRPEWQLGWLNGVGGKIEPTELPLAAMRREFFEETGVQQDEWESFLTLQSKTWICHCFRAFVDNVDCVETKTDEEIIVTSHQLLPTNCLPNLSWIIPLALEHPGSALVEYSARASTN